GRVVGFEAGAHQPELAFQRLVEPAPAEQDAHRNEAKCNPEQAGSQLRRIDTLELEKAINRDRRVDEQQAAQRQAKDADKAAIGIMCRIHHGPGRERLGYGALPRRPIVKTTRLLVTGYSRRAERASDRNSRRGCLRAYYRPGAAKRPPGSTFMTN